jgi:uncharacterized protein YciI
MNFILFYDLPLDYIERRERIRPAHLDLVMKTHDRGELLMAGALSEPYDQALLVFSSYASAENFVKNDPYIKDGLIKS